MKATDFHWFFVAMDESTDVTQHNFVFICGTDMEFNIVELAAFMPMWGTTTSEDLYESKKVLQRLYIPIQKLASLVTDGVPSAIGKVLHPLYMPVQKLARLVWLEGTVAWRRLSPTTWIMQRIAIW
jgi:hypothetical protein